MSAVPENVLRHELIGLNVKIVRSPNRSLRGRSGLIVNESKNMLTLSRKGRKVLIPKNVATFRFKLADGRLVDVDGSRLLGRPENRLKTRIRRW
ncbi:MAG TPA: ribonuclease P protein component 1 [Methylomirabilota bacterium]|nr:ribonuclease P protein component 1 [Methylomirabilota bacterium]